MNHLPIRSSLLLLLLLLLLRHLLLASATSCSQPATGGPADRLRERIVAFDPDASGESMVRLELFQRQLRIDPASPWVAEMLASSGAAGVTFHGCASPPNASA